MRTTTPFRWAKTTTAMAVVAVAGSLALAAPAQAEPRPPAGNAAEIFPYPDAELTLVNHRGLSPGYPENTLAAFRNSIALGVDAIEVDLRATKDGEIVILHDDTVDRTTDGTGRIGDLTLEQAKALDAGSHAGAGFAGERVPTYAETLAAVKGSGVRLLLDIKESSRVAKIVEITEAHGMASQVIVGPRTVQALKDFKALNPDLATLGFIGTAADADAFIAAGVDYIRLWPDWITGSRDDAACRADHAARTAAYRNGERAHPGSASCVVEHVVSQGTPVWSTTNDLGREPMDELIRLGATGLLSDVPTVLAGLLADIETERRTTARGQVADLRALIERDRKKGHHQRRTRHVKALLKELDRAGRQLAAGDARRACGTLGGAARAVPPAGFPATAAAGYLAALDRARATLACSRFG